MRCSDLMKMDLQWVPATATVKEAARLMRDRSIGFLLVEGPTPGVLVGVVTDRDLAIRGSAIGKRPDEMRVADVATTDVVACGRHDDLKLAERTMVKAEKSRLVIVDEIGRAVGVLSLADILRHDRTSRAIKTARGVLARETDGPHPPIDSIHLTPSTPEEEDRAARQGTAVHGGDWAGTMKEFP